MLKKQIRKILVLLLAVSVICSGNSMSVFAASLSFSMDFTALKSTDSLPSGVTVPSGTVTVGNGYIDLSQGSLMLLPSNITSADFTYKVNFTIISATEPSRWAGFLFRYQGTNKYMQMCCRQSASKAGGIDTSYWNGTWNYPSNAKGSYESDIDPAKMYTAKIVVKGNAVALYLNDKLCVVSNTLLDGTGQFGIQTSGSVVRIYGIDISDAEDVPDGTEYVKDIYEPNTGIVSSPTVIQNIDTASKLNALNTNQERTQVAKFKIADSNLNVSVDGTSYTMDQIMAKCGKAVLPMFVTSDTDTAKAFAEYITAKSITDVILASENTGALSAAWAIQKIGIRYAYIAGALSSTNTAAKITRNTHIGCATIAIVDNNEQLTRANVEYMQIRAVYVWLNSASTSDKDVVFAAVDCGANGVTVKEYTTAYDLYEYVKDVTNIRRTFFVGHRGFPTRAPENSKESYLEAVNAGADAIECDVQITSDGVLVSNHNGSVDGYTTSGALGAVSSFTWDQLSQFTLKPVGQYAQSQFCKLEWYFQILKDNPKLVGFVELKNSSDAVAKKTVELAESIGVEDQVFYICFADDGLKSIRNYAPYAGTGRLGSGFYNSTATLKANLNNFIKTVGNTAASADFLYTEFTPEILKAGRHRGITFQSWTVDDALIMAKEYLSGINAITTNLINYQSKSTFNTYKSVIAATLFNGANVSNTSESVSSNPTKASTSDPTKASTSNSTSVSSSTGEHTNPVTAGDHSATPLFAVTILIAAGILVVLNSKKVITG